MNFDKLKDKLRAWPWLVMAVICCGVVAIIAPWQIGVLLWTLTKLSIAAYLGYWIDRTIFPYGRPHEAPSAHIAYNHQIRRAIIVVGAMMAFNVHAAPVPDEAEQYHALLVSEAQMQFGLDAPVARLAAQVQQESQWRSNAQSPVGAQGLTQFMPSTAAWISRAYPKELGGAAAPFSPEWSLRALAVYDRYLYDRTKGRTDCDRWWFALRGYNGGLGHVQAEARNATDPLDHTIVDAVCGSARRSAKHCPENLGYPRKIMLRWEPMYLKAHWPGRLACKA